MKKHNEAGVFSEVLTIKAGAELNLKAKTNA